MSELERITRDFNQQPRRLWTVAELLALFGTEHAPCSSCGATELVITQYGEVVCPSCVQFPFPLAYRVVLVDEGGRLVMRDKQKIDEQAERLRQDKERLAYQLAHQEEVDALWDAGIEPMDESALFLAKARGLFGARPSKIDGANDPSTGGNRCASTNRTCGTAPDAKEKSRSRGSTSRSGSAQNAKMDDQQQKLF